MRPRAGRRPRSRTGTGPIYAPMKPRSGLLNRLRFGKTVGMSVVALTPRPLGERGGVLVDRGARDPAAVAGVVGAVDGQRRHPPEQAAALDGAADDQVMAAPAVVAAVAVAEEGAPEVGGGEGGDAVLDLHLDRRRVEGGERVVDLLQQLHLRRQLAAMRVEAAGGDEEHLALLQQLRPRLDELRHPSGAGRRDRSAGTASAAAAGWRTRSAAAGRSRAHAGRRRGSPTGRGCRSSPAAGRAAVRLRVGRVGGVVVEPRRAAGLPGPGTARRSCPPGTCSCRLATCSSRSARCR